MEHYYTNHNREHLDDMRVESGEASRFSDDSDEPALRYPSSSSVRTTSVDRDYPVDIDDFLCKAVDEKGLIPYCRRPLRGSLVSLFSQRERRNAASFSSFMKDKFLGRMVSVALNEDVAFLSWFVAHLVLPHDLALAFSEVVKKTTLTEDGMINPSVELGVIGLAFGVQVREKRDLFKVLKKIAVYQPEIATWIVSMISSSGVVIKGV
jgi:hypothetical protein